MPFGTANISINAAAKAAINGSWAQLLPDSILINHMPTEYVAVLPARAVQLGYSNWEGPPYSFVDIYATGPFDNVLAFKVSSMVARLQLASQLCRKSRAPDAVSLIYWLALLDCRAAGCAWLTAHLGHG